MTVVGAFLLVLLLLLPGTAVWLNIGGMAKRHVRGVEALFLWLLAGLATVSWLALTLAEFDRFSLPLLSGIVVGGTVLVGGIGWRNGRVWQPLSHLPWHWSDWVIGLLLIIAVFLSGRPSEYIVGGRDHGVYVNTGIYIAKTGGILVQDSEITAVQAELRSVLVWPETRLYQAGFPGPWSEGQRLSGLTIRDTDAGIYLPHAFHLYPALIAVFYAAGGVPLALLTTMVLALTGSLAIHLVTARLFGQPVGFLTLLLLTFSLTQVWFTGYPTAEIMVQVFFWGGLFLLLLLLETGNRATAVLAGACFGLLTLAKLDTVLVPVTLAVVFLYLWLRRQFQPAYWWAIGVYLLLNIQALWHASVIATIYFLDHAVRVLLPTFIANPLVAAADGYPYPADWLTRLFAANWPNMLLSAMGLIVGLLLLGWLRPRLDSGLRWLFHRPRRWQLGLPLGLGVVMVGTAVLSQSVDLPMIARTDQALQLSRLYLTRAGLIAGLLGSLLLIYKAETTAARLSLFILAGNIAPLYLLGAGTALDHFWVVRRFVPLAFPVMLLGMAQLIWFLWPHRADRWFIAVVPLGILLLLLAGFGQHLRFVAGLVEYNGLTAQLGELADSLPDEAVLLMEAPNAAQRLDLPLWFIFDKTIFTVQSDVRDDMRLKTAITNWVENGRSVYWLAADGAPAPAWAGWQIQQTHSQTISTPLMETPSDRIPTELLAYQVNLDIYQLTPP